MEAQDRSRSPSRKTSRVEQVVGRWLRRSRDLGSRSHSLSRWERRVTRDMSAHGRAGAGRDALLLCRDRPAHGKAAESDQRSYSFRFTVQIQRDPGLRSHGLTLTAQSPILVQDITPGRTRSTVGVTCGSRQMISGLGRPAGGQGSFRRAA